jgi:hypothetical protein
MWCGIEVRWPSSSGKGWPYHPSQRVSHLNPYRNHISLIFKLVGVWCNHYYLIIFYYYYYFQKEEKREERKKKKKKKREKKYVIIIITPTTPHPNK